MHSTENYTLNLPDYGDNADVEKINENTNAIDNLIYRTRRMEVDGYDKTLTYNTGDMVEHDHALYKCKEDSVTGNWDSTKWESTTLADEIESKGEGGADVTKEVSGNPVEFDDGADAPLVKCVSAITGYQQGSGTPSPDNVRPIVAYTEGEIEVSDGDGNVTTHTTTYPSAIYRGSEDVVNGSVTSEMQVIKISDLTWTYYANYSRFGSNISDMFPWQAARIGFILSDSYETINDGRPIANVPAYCIYNGGGLSIFIHDARYTDVATFVNNMGDSEIVFQLATPTTSSVTPTNLPIKSLSGYTHIESSTGDLDIEYITEDFQPIVDLIEANASEPYSDDYTLDTEIEVGTWVDGSTLYRKTKEITGNKNAGYEGTIYTAESGEHIVKLDGCIYNDYYSGMAYPINMAYSTNNGTMAFSTLVTGSDAETVFFKNGWNSAISKIYLVVYYIKSSS